MTQVSKSWMVCRNGKSPEIHDLAVSVLGSTEVRIRVTATGLNFADLLMIKGTYQATPPLPFAPGMEVSGVIEHIGDGVRHLAPGDRVTAVTGSGGLATHVNVAASSVLKIPEGMSDVEAAGFQIVYGTSHLALTRRAHLQANETLVVLGASGGVGLTAVEVGHALGAKVIALAGGDRKLEIARAAGADVLIDSNRPDFLEAFRENGPINVVYDAVGGAAGEAALRAMAPEGRFVVIGFASGNVPALKANHLMVKNQTVIGVFWGGYREFNRAVLTESLSELLEWYEQGKIRPHIGHVLPFDRALEGLELLRTRQATGKVVITQ